MMFRPYTAIAAASILLGSTSLAAAALARVESDLNVRSGPGTEYRVVGVLPGGAPVDVGPCNGGWCRVNYRGISGFASASYLDFARGPAVAVAPTYEYDYYDYGYGPGFWDYGYAYGPSFGIAIGGRHFRHHRHWSGRDHWGGRDQNWSGRDQSLRGRSSASWQGRGAGGRAAISGGGAVSARAAEMSAGGRGGASVNATVGRGGGGTVGRGGGGRGGRR
jgi:hypothetical protein